MLRIGTRHSALAQVQAHWVEEKLHAAFPDLKIEIIGITTSGDQGALGATDNLKAAFTKEIEEALLANRIDLAVHSLKDLAAEIPPGLALAAVPVREDPRDVWVGKTDVHFTDLREGARVATSAVRRQAQLLHARPDLDIVPIRGNVDTRLRKLEENNWDGMVLALAGLKRLGREIVVTDIFPLKTMLPAIGQGALALEARAKDSMVEKYLQALDDHASHQAVLAERAFLQALGGSCQTPIAAYAQIQGNSLEMSGLVVAPKGDPCLRESHSGPVKDAERIGQELGKKLLRLGAGKLL